MEYAPAAHGGGYGVSWEELMMTTALNCCSLVSHSLSWLNGRSLSGNSIGDEGARALADAIPRCPNLQTLLYVKFRVFVVGLAVM